MVTLDHLMQSMWQDYLNPRISIALGCAPGIDKALLVESGEVREPLLQAEQSSMCGGSCYLLVRNDPPFHS